MNCASFLTHPSSADPRVYCQVSPRKYNPGAVVTRGVSPQLIGEAIARRADATHVLKEHIPLTPDGELLSHSPTTYKIPNIQDLPATFNVACIDNDTNTVNIRGSKAVGEPPLLLGISVYMAVKNALSFVSHGEIPKINAPATGEEILMRLTHYASHPAVTSDVAAAAG